MTGLVLDGAGFEVLADGERVGPRRLVQDADATLLRALTDRYVHAVRVRSGVEVFVGLGRELFGWLDGDLRQLAGLLSVASAPLVFEVQAPARPAESAWTVLRAPWELLAGPGDGFLAADAFLRFGVVRRLGVAGPRPALDGFRLGLAFMASAPRSQVELDFEAEEAAILAAVGDTRVDLVVEDSGDPVQLGRRLADLGGLPVVHLSCHGTNQRRRPGEPSVPALLMEDEVGGERPTTAADLVGLLTHAPRLVFVSAGLAAADADAAAFGQLPPVPAQRGRTGGQGADRDLSRAGGSDGGVGVAHSLATGLVSAGIAAALGWDGSVDHRAATLFAQRLYGRLGDRTDLAVAVADARRALLESDDVVVHRDWHLARLWLGPAGGGRLVGGVRRRSMVPAHHATKTFLDRKQHVPVAAPSMFVGRRLELQRALRVVRSGDRAGVILQGQGRLGKSSLAARIADRCPDMAVAVVFGDYTAMAILDAVTAAVQPDPQARETINRGREEVRHHPEAIETVLIDLLTGACAQAGEAQRTLLLVIDDLEQILLPDKTGPHRVSTEHTAVLAAVIRAFDTAYTDSRLLLTTRYTFTLDGLERRLELIQLPPLSPITQRKLLRRQQGLTDPQRATDRAALADRAVVLCRGNPGLQDLIGLRLVHSDDKARAEAVVTGMERYLQRGDLPDDAEVREFLEGLALDALLTQAGTAHVELLRAATLFQIPVPESVLDILAGTVGGSVARLRGLGLLDSFPDGFDPARPAVAVNALAAGRLHPLDSGDRPQLAALSVGALFAAWGGPAAQDRRDEQLDLQLAGLALDGGDPVVVASCAADAVVVLRQGLASEAFAFGQDAIGLLDRVRHPVPTKLLRKAAAAALTSGDGAAGEALLRRAIDQVTTDPADGARSGIDPLDQARVLTEYALCLRTRGEPDQAQQLLEQAYDLFTTAQSPREAATAMGAIAHIAYRRGDYDEALRIRREVQLPVYESLGDTRETATTWSNIADISYQRGDYDEALRIRREIELPAFERLRDTRSAAVTWGNIADISYQRGDYDEALRIRREVQLPAFERFGDAHSTALTWGRIADIAYQRGDYDEALRIRREIELPAYERLGDTRSTAVTWGKIADITYQRGDYDEVLRIRREVQLPVYERLGDTRETATAWGSIADIAYRRGDYDEALRIRHEVQLPVYERLGDTRFTAITWGRIADIIFKRGDYDEALRIRREVQLPVYERLGDTRAAALTWGRIADIAYQRRDYDEALRIRHEIELPTYEHLGDTRSTAVTWGAIADIAYQRGDYDEALRIRREVQLPVYERLGDTRATVLTWSSIADMAYRCGGYDVAAELHRQCLDVSERLGDLDGIASASWGLAQVDLARQDYQAAAPRLATAFQIFEQLQRPDGIATVGTVHGQLLSAAGQPGNAGRVLEASLHAATKVGRTDLIGHIAALLETPPDPTGDHD